MNLDEYTQEVLQSTEKLEKVKVNGKLLINSLALFISAGRLLNQVKSKIDGNLYDGETGRCKCKLCKKIPGFFDGKRGYVYYVFTADRNRKRFGLRSFSVTPRAR